jgi:glycosyltransferase involved in cell wall biosynthesis
VGRICLYYRAEPEKDRWLRGDRFVRPIIRRIVRGKPRPGGLDKVFINLCLGLDKLGVPYEVNLPFSRLGSDDHVGVLGRGPRVLAGYNRPNPIVAGIGLMNHPSEWPSLCTDYPVVKYLQHSKWANDIFIPYYGKHCDIWPVGIDTEVWKPQPIQKTTDFLIYDKVRWDHDQYETSLLQPVRIELSERGLSFAEIRYGYYREEEFHKLLGRCRAMIFLCEHETQGLAYQECLSSGVPILAWDQGWWLDPNRSKWGQAETPATSVPYFDERCGITFANISQFPDRLSEFWARLQAGSLHPRDYILDNLTLEKCAQDYLRIAARCS